MRDNPGNSCLRLACYVGTLHATQKVQHGDTDLGSCLIRLPPDSAAARLVVRMTDDGQH